MNRTRNTGTPTTGGILAAVFAGAILPVVVIEVLHQFPTTATSSWQALRLFIAGVISAAAAYAITSWLRGMFDKRANLEPLVAASQQMSNAAKQLGFSTEKLSLDSQHYVQQINSTSAAVDEIVDSIQQVASNTSASHQVAEEARRTATIGSKAVENTIKGMDRIRSQVQENARRIKHLGESTQQIGEIVQLISDVADRTSLLALNASIQAAMAGEAGQGFAVVAEEVELLSKRCNDATKQMTRLVKSVQVETADAVSGMEESISEVVEGSKLASQAGDALADIDAVSDRLAGLIESISTAAKQQVRGGVLASRSMNEISVVMHENAMGTSHAAQSSGQLASDAEELCNVVQQVAHPNASSYFSSIGNQKLDDANHTEGSDVNSEPLASV